MNDSGPARAIRWLFDPRHGTTNQFLPRWLFLRAMGLIYFSAFFSLLFQIRGLIGPDGVLPASEYLDAVAKSAAAARFWYAPTVFWFSTGSHMLMAVCWVGLATSMLVVFNILPRVSLLICFVGFLSFVAASGEFSGYQSDGMLLEAGFIVLFLAPIGFRPGLGTTQPPIRAGIFLLLWEWFRIYFESGIAKIASGDPEWRHFTAMDEYYQNGPLPTWIGWYMQHLPHWFHAATAGATLVLELGIVWMLFLPRRWKIVCFFIVTAWQIPVILTANYTFLNYLVLVLGVLLLDDRFLERILPSKLRPQSLASTLSDTPREELPKSRRRQIWSAAALTASSLMLTWIFYATTAEMLGNYHLPMSPVLALEPFRIANRYGLFAVMTRGRYEKIGRASC